MFIYKQNPYTRLTAVLFFWTKRLYFSVKNDCKLKINEGLALLKYLVNTVTRSSYDNLCVHPTCTPKIRLILHILYYSHVTAYFKHANFCVETALSSKA